MLKIKQTNCLFVNFEKRKQKLNEIGNISFFLNNKDKKQIHAYIQTDRYLFRQRKNAQKKGHVI
jgi:hypothetical protein